LFDSNSSGLSAVLCGQIGYLRRGFRLNFAYAVSIPDRDAQHRVYITFQCRCGWHCKFLEQDLNTPLPRKLHFKSAEKIIMLVARCDGSGNLESKQMLGQAIKTGQGEIFLSLTPEQHTGLLHH
jgi:hypothetical protein